MRIIEDQGDYVLIEHDLRRLVDENGRPAVVFIEEMMMKELLKLKPDDTAECAMVKGLLCGIISNINNARKDIREMKAGDDGNMQMLRFTLSTLDNLLPKELME